MRRLGPFCLRGPALAFIGRHWLPWGFGHLRWVLWAFVDLRWPLVAVVGCYGPLLSIKWKKKLKKNTPRAQTTPDASFGPFVDFVGLRWPSLATQWLLWAFVGLCWPSLAVVGCRGLSWACVGLRWSLLAAMGLFCQ